MPATLEWFPKSKQVKCGLKSACKECTRVANKANQDRYYAENKAKVNAKNKENYYKKHPKEVLLNGLKRCGTCGLIKPTADFNKLQTAKDGLKYSCKDCQKQDYVKNQDKRIRQSREYYQTNKTKQLQTTKRYRQRNVEWYQKYNRDYYKDNKDKMVNNSKKSLYRRMKEDKGFLILQRCRKRMYDALKGYSKSARTQQLIGCTPDKLKMHIEKQFTTGMTWDNYGKWHIDHIVPCASFDFSKAEEQRKCFHYTNLQPLWAVDNIRKSDKILAAGFAIRRWF